MWLFASKNWPKSLNKCRPYSQKAALLSYIEKLQREDLLELERKHAQQIEIQKEIDLNERERQIQKDRKAVEAQILNEQVCIVATTVVRCLV